VRTAPHHPAYSPEFRKPVHETPLRGGVLPLMMQALERADRCGPHPFPQILL